MTAMMIMIADNMMMATMVSFNNPLSLSLNVDHDEVYNNHDNSDDNHDTDNDG